GLGSLAGWDYTTAADGEYTVLSGAVDTTNLGNLGLANAVTFGDNRKAYFESGSLKVVVIPEPSAVLLLGLGALGLGLRRRR
nr:PEP-CTERM sorting domain-containing protein [Akkermansiaceae bacterium]